MTTAILEPSLPLVLRDDLPRDVFDQIEAAGEVACDIETSGLEWTSARIALCQFYFDGHQPILVRIGRDVPRNVCRLIESGSIIKVFHHATFDLSFMTHHWRVMAANVWCTKIAAKLLTPGADRHSYSLQRLANDELGVHIDKSARLSNWFARKYNAKQITYAAKDVTHLLDLKRNLLRKLEASDKTALALRVFAHIPTRVWLDVDGYGDVYSY